MSHAERIAEQLRMAEEERAATDDDNETMSDNDNPETDESTESETNETPIGAEYDVPLTGMLALDRTDKEGNRCVVVANRGKRAEDLKIAATGKTIAEHNPEEPADAPVVDVVYKGALEERWGDRWQEWTASWLTYKVGNEAMRTYGFPVTRLLFGPEYSEVIKEQGRDEASTSEDEDAEVVTDGGLFEARTKGMAFDGMEVDLTTRATEAGEEAEDKAEKVHMDLKARFQRLAQAYDEGQHPDEGTPFMSVDWESVLGLDEEDGDEDPEVMTDGGTVEKAEPDETLLLTDEGLQMPDMLRGYVGQFHVKTADITGQYNTTDSGLPDTEFWDGVLAVYPDDDGDYNPHLGEGLIEVYTTDKSASKVFEVVDKRTEEDNDE